MEKIWRQTKEDLQSRISSNCFKMWIDPLELVISREGKVSLACPNRFFLNWVRENYLPDIKKSWEQHSGTAKDLHLRLATTTRKSTRDREDSSQLPLPLPTKENGHQHRLNRRCVWNRDEVRAWDITARLAGDFIVVGLKVCKKVREG